MTHSYLSNQAYTNLPCHEREEGHTQGGVRARLSRLPAVASLRRRHRRSLSAAVLAVIVLQHLVLIAMTQLVREGTELPAAVHPDGIAIVFHCALEPSFVATSRWGGEHEILLRLEWIDSSTAQSAPCDHFG